MSSPSTDRYWRRKIHALLHDTPDKATDIRSHEQRAESIKSIFQFDASERFDRESDWFAAAADRLPFPSPAALLQPLDEIKSLPHPLGGSTLPNTSFVTANEALEITQKSHPFLLDNDDPRAAFLCIWRFWRNWACSLDARFTRLPADTRIPDHTIWNHLNITTAWQGCLPSKELKEAQKEAHPGEDLRQHLLLFSIGPVQDFITASRSTRDLWSGSYLLSYLVSTALGKIARELGPDHVIFPNLLDQPLLDLQLKEDIFGNVKFSGEPIWEALDYTNKNISQLLTPSLPNRFMALLPARHPASEMTAAEFAADLAETVKGKLKDIADSVQSFLAKHPAPHILDFDCQTFHHQVDQLLEIHWQLLPLPASFDAVYKFADELLPKDDGAAGYTPRAAIEAIGKMIQRTTCKPQYDPRPGSAWALLNATISFLHDGTKSNRSFDAWREGRWQSGKSFNKDALNGREEAVLRVTGPDSHRETVESYCSSELGLSRGTLKSGELLGASTLIKRLWNHTFLPKEIGISSERLRAAHPMPNTRSIGAGMPFANDSDESEESDRYSDKYFAILALDGDQMGKWVSGSKTPANREVLSPNAREFYQRYAPEFLDAHRAVTPSWHLQFAEALGNFSFQAAQRIVEAFDGRLIYAGGDDVLAMLPARDAIPCARALRAAFRGEKDTLNQICGKITQEGEARKSDRRTRLFACQHEGFLQLHPDSGATHGAMRGLISAPVNFPAIVPGPRSDVSVGIAIAHFKSPLQDVVRAAQAAEKRAKRGTADGGLGRGAVAVSIYKRSGEILEWGTRWAQVDENGNPTSIETAGFRLLQVLSDALIRGQLNARFPHKFEALLTPYLPTKREDDSTFVQHFPAILEIELDHCLARNEGDKLSPEDRQLFVDYWNELSTSPPGGKSRKFADSLTLLINLLRTAAWIVRGAEKLPSAAQFKSTQASNPPTSDSHE